MASISSCSGPRCAGRPPPRSRGGFPSAPATAARSCSPPEPGPPSTSSCGPTSRALATEWDAADPRTAHDIAQFFRTSTSYLYNLAIWEASGNRPAYVPLALPTLVRRGSKTVLDYGCGIGSDTLPLRQSGFDVVGCDFESPSTAFLRWRSHETISVIEPRELALINAPDTLWIIDTLDHLADIETSLGTVLSTVDLMVTENLTTNRGHGQQRFHTRRPYSELVSLFARYGLFPIDNAATTTVMFWARDQTQQ